MTKSKHIKHLITVLIVFAMAVATVLPASAASETWQTRFSEFTEISAANAGAGTYSGYVKAAQRFLQCYNSTTYDYIMDNGGVDGYYGTSTRDAVKEFQGNTGLSNDGVVGSNTWKKMASLLVASTSSLTTTFSSPYSFYLRDANIIKAVGSSTISYYSYDENGSQISTRFRYA